MKLKSAGQSVVVAVLLAALPAIAAGDETQIGAVAPMFRLPVYNSDAVGATAVGLDRFVGPDPSEQGVKVVVVSFMASFCAPCKKELPYLQALYTKHKDAGLRVVSISIDGEPEGQKIVEDLIATHKVTFPVLKDRFQVVGRRWLGTQTPLPSVFLVSPDGTIRGVHRGYNKDVGSVLTAEVIAALKGSPAAKATAVATE